MLPWLAKFFARSSMEFDAMALNSALSAGPAFWALSIFRNISAEMPPLAVWAVTAVAKHMATKRVMILCFMIIVIVEHASMNARH